MMGCISARLVSVLLVVAIWLPGSLASYASWFGLRGVQVQNIVALEGGLLSNGTFENNEWTGVDLVQHPNGLYFKMDLTKPLNIPNQDPEQILTAESENTNPRAPNYVNGGMFHNDYQWYTFG